MTITLVAAHDPNLVIGKDGGLPWRYPEDLKFFKQTTWGGTIIMGRGVFEELNHIPLPGRRNLVLSTTRKFDEAETFHSIEDALAAVTDNEAFIIGGGTIYRQTIGMADKLIITEIHKNYDGDTFFPEYRNGIGEVWEEETRENREEISFVTYKRIR